VTITGIVLAGYDLFHYLLTLLVTRDRQIRTMQRATTMFACRYTTTRAYLPTSSYAHLPSPSYGLVLPSPAGARRQRVRRALTAGAQAFHRNTYYAFLPHSDVVPGILLR